MKNNARIANAGFAQVGGRSNLEHCAMYQVLYWLTVLRSETRTNEKPENLQCYFTRALN